ncbi:MAG TPA: aldolase/citrate lyase family protein [Solirubrobacteraceae bacterium]|nr:aldolase/citrate lyase family protein [Solirubrobacteraceae bacterium]
MSEQELRGVPAAPGVALGVAWLLTPAVAGARRVDPPLRDAECERALAALDAAAQALTELATRLPATEGEIVEAGALMAGDPALAEAVRRAVLEDGLAAGPALVSATGEFADAIAAVGDELLAARADDVRSLGRRAAALASGDGQPRRPAADCVVIAAELGPADVAELAPAPAGFALAGGGPTAHAAIVARSLGIPMVTGLGEAVHSVLAGTSVILDGAAGTLTVEPDRKLAESATLSMRARVQAARRARELRETPAVTVDERRVGVLANVATPQELWLALEAGAEGIGLLRTELAFLDARAWPSEQEHARLVERVLSGLGARPAVVRVLDFGADKSPPFLNGTPLRGLELLLSHPDAFADQLRALVACAEHHDVRILLPMVDRADQVEEARRLIDEVRGGAPMPPVGAMIETPSAVLGAAEIARSADFLSVGTNDLTSSVLRADRFNGGVGQAHHPAVLKAIATAVQAARTGGVAIEVCGEAASDPVMLPLLVGLGVDELSVGAARVGEIRERIRALHAGEAEELAQRALESSTPEQVEASVATPSARRP